jgi:hypothetical protein
MTKIGRLEKMPSGPMNRYRDRNSKIGEKCKDFSRPGYSLLQPSLNLISLTITNQKNQKNKEDSK